MPKIPRPLRLGSVALLGFATIALTGSLTSANAATAAPPPAASSLSTLRNSLPATTDPQTGSYSAPSMTVEVALAPQNQAGLNSALQAIYTEGSSQYHQFLSAGQFDAQYAPSAAERASVASYLAGEGLTVASTNSPFLLSVAGSSAKITAAFHTSLSNYVDPRGIRYFQNSRTLQVPTSIVSDIQGVVGLTNTVREHSGVVKPLTGKAAASSAAASASCETGLRDQGPALRLRQQGDQLPVRLRRRPRLQRPHAVADQLHLRRACRQPGNPGLAVNAAVFELSAYLPSDIATWASTFYGAGYTPRLSNVNVDGGPLDPVCPAGDSCPPAYESYAGDIEVVADIENTLAVAKDSHVIVYNAPNDQTGQTELDEYTAIANQDSGGHGQLQLGRVRERRHGRLRPGGEHHLRADGVPGPERVQLLGRHRGVRLHPQRRHHDRGPGRPVVPAVGDQRRRHLAGKRQPGHQPAPRAAGQGHRDRLERPQPVQ